MMARRVTIAMALVVAAASGCERAPRDRSSATANVVVTDVVGAKTVGPVSRPGPASPTKAGQGLEAPLTGAPQSQFTSLDVAMCQLIARNDEEAGYARHRCAGAAGYQVELVESDLRQTIEIVRPGAKSYSLELSALVAGGGFSSVGKVAEWRGADPANPRTLTFRYGVNEDPDPAVAPRSYLVVAKLAAPLCVVARVSPGPDQSIRARRIADQTRLPPCLTTQ